MFKKPLPSQNEIKAAFGGTSFNVAPDEKYREYFRINLIYQDIPVNLQINQEPNWNSIRFAFYPVIAHYGYGDFFILTKMWQQIKMYTDKSVRLTDIHRILPAATFYYGFNMTNGYSDCNCSLEYPEIIKAALKPMVKLGIDVNLYSKETGMTVSAHEKIEWKKGMRKCSRAT